MSAVWFCSRKRRFDKTLRKFSQGRSTKLFFKYLFLTNNELISIQCYRCDEFLATKEYQRKHNFLEHYSDSKNLPFEEKPIQIKNIHGLTTYEISFEKHANYYNFLDPDTIIEEFLMNVRHRFKSIGEDVSIKCGFSIQNIQPAPTNYTVAMVNPRYWSTDVYRTTYFNDHVFSNLSNKYKEESNC